MGILIFGLFVINWIDTLLRPVVVSSRAEMNSAIALIGMIGGTIAFGIVGFILGPLILAYLILLIEIYNDKKQESIVFKKEPTIP
jgi:predicted PurR-regulated permease PerM